MNRLRRRTTATTTAAVALLLTTTLAPSHWVGPAAARATPAHWVTLTAGTGALTTWPAYQQSVERYAVLPSASDNHSLVVTASTADPDGTVLVDGRPARSGMPTTVTGLVPGDEVSVVIDDAGGHSTQSWIYLPSTFPVLSTSGTLGEGDDHVFLTLSNFLTSTPYETIVDRNAVPSWFEQGNGGDLKPVDLGATRYSMARHDTAGGYRIDELDARLHTIRSHQLDGTPGATDFHDSELLPDGRALLLGYTGAQRNGTSYLDAVIQIVDADGHAVFTWNSKDHVDPSEAYVDGGVGDYAHINSLQYLPASGDILASFRNLSQVMLIAGPDDPDHTAGDVIWRLGGERNDFTFLDDPYGGNCAQHMARMLPDGDLMLFDNGSRHETSGPIASQSADMCPDPADPTGPRIARPQTRITEYALDTSNPADLKATLVWSYVPVNRYAAFAGSQQRLADGSTFVGWSQATPATGSAPPEGEPVASLVAADQTEVWKLFAGGWFSYRVAIGPSPDAIDPTVHIGLPKPGATYTEGTTHRMRFTCIDAGGSNLDTCAGSIPNGHKLDMTPGTHTVHVTATDGAGNTRTTRVRYHVAPLSRPDAQVRSEAGEWVGNDVYGGPDRQHVVDRIARGTMRTTVRLQNDGRGRDTLRLEGAGESRAFTVRYLHAGNDVTPQVRAGTLRTSALDPGASYTLTVVVHRTAHATDGDRRVFTVRATSTHPEHARDAVAVVARAT